MPPKSWYLSRESIQCYITDESQISIHVKVSQNLISPVTSFSMTLVIFRLPRVCNENSRLVHKFELHHNVKIY